MRIVATFAASTGRVVDRPHLGLEFADGTLTTGLTVRQVERD